ncbi:unnamed protein product, partial [Polarella glacialis]
DAPGAEVSEVPQVMEKGHGVSAAACGSGHSAFVVGGKLFTFGSNESGVLGREAGSGDAQPGHVVIEASDGHRPACQQISLGSKHSAAITEGGVLWTWGYGGSFWYGAGALGLSKRQEVVRPEMVQTFVQRGVEVKQVACGGMHTIVLDTQGRLFTTGEGKHGRLGRGSMFMLEELEFGEVTFFSQNQDSVMNPGEEPQIIKVDAGQNFSAALSRHGEIWVWGANDSGQLGMGQLVMAVKDFGMKYPFLIRTLPLEGHSLQDIACGENHMIAVTTAGAIYEWGARRYFEPRPISLPSRYQDGIKGIVKLAAGDRCSFALTNSGKLYSWGEKSTGCLLLGPE